MTSEVLPVSVGVLTRSDGQLLVAQRAGNLDQGGLWEFPGGKIESGENPYEALVREIQEEIGVSIVDARPLIRIRHHYGDRSVLLHVWRVTCWNGEVSPCLGQPLQWMPWSGLAELSFPGANRLIIAAARLPQGYAIVPLDTEMSASSLRMALDNRRANGAGLIQLRGKGIGLDVYAKLAATGIAWGRSNGIPVLLNAAPEVAAALNAEGVHLNVQRLMQAKRRPLPDKFWVSCACHTAEELAQAARIDVNCALLGTVLESPSHPGVESLLGWERFAALVGSASVPVYALGGVSKEHEALAGEAGAVGIAGIRAFV